MVHNEEAQDTLGSTKGTDEKYDDLLEEVSANEDGDEDGDGVVVRAEKVNDTACVDHEEGEEEAAEHAQTASVERASAHDNSKGGEQDTGKCECSTPQERPNDDLSAGTGRDAVRSGQGAATGEGAGDIETKGDGGDTVGTKQQAAEEKDAQEGARAVVKHAQSVAGGKESSRPQDGVADLGSPRLQPTDSPQISAAESSSSCVIDKAPLPLTMQSGAETSVPLVHGNTAMGKRIPRHVSPHPEAPAKKTQKADALSHAAPVASPARAGMGALAKQWGNMAVAGMSTIDTSIDRRSRSPRTGSERAHAGTEKRTQSCSGRQKRSERRAGSEASALPQLENVGPGESLVIPHAIKCGRILEDQLNAKKKYMRELASSRDYNGAAVAHEAVKEIEAHVEELCQKSNMIDEFAVMENYTAAATVLKEIKAKEELIMKKYASNNSSTEGADAQVVAHHMNAQEQLATKKRIRDELSKKEDFLGAAAVHAQVQELEKCISVQVAGAKAADPAGHSVSDRVLSASEILEERLIAKKNIMHELAGASDYKGAAAAHGEMKQIEAIQKELREKVMKKEELVLRKDYAGAAVAAEDIVAIEREIMERYAAKNEGREVAAAEAVAQDIKTHEEQLTAKKMMVAKLADDMNYLGAAVAQEEVQELEQRLSVLVATASPTVPAQTPLPSSASGTQSDSRVGSKGQRGAGSGKSLVSVENARLLSASKVTQVPARIQPKGATKGKSGGRKGGGKKVPELAREDFAAIYLGCISTKQIYHVLAYGDQVDKLRAYVDLVEKPIVNVTNLERRPGREELFCTDDTVITTCLEPTEGEGSARFTYDVSQVTKHLATLEFGTKAPLGHFVDLVLCVGAVDELSIQSGPNFGAPYLQVSGWDMDGVDVGPLRLWNHAVGDVDVGNICIFRGLKVSTERQWNGEKYVSNRDGAKKLDSDARTAIEDVSDQPAITSYFDFT